MISIKLPRSIISVSEWLCKSFLRLLIYYSGKCSLHSYQDSIYDSLQLTDLIKSPIYMQLCLSSLCHICTWLFVINRYSISKRQFFSRLRLEEWLRVMLEWEPAVRGQVQGEGGSKQVVAFSMINDILNKKVNTVRWQIQHIYWMDENYLE